MRRFLTKVVVVVVAAGVSVVAAQDRVARTPSGASEAQTQRVSQGQAAIDRAAAAQKYIFIFFYTEQDSHTSAMKGVFDTAMAKMTDRADAMAINIGDPAEKPIVDKFGTAGLPCRWCWRSLQPGLPPALSPNSLRSPSSSRRLSARARRSA